MVERGKTEKGTDHFANLSIAHDYDTLRCKIEASPSSESNNHVTLDFDHVNLEWFFIVLNGSCTF